MRLAVKDYLFRRLSMRLALCCLSLVLATSATLPSFAQSKTTSRKATGASLSPRALFSVSAFTDVPTTHPFYTEITNIAERQITAGCGGGNYCPDSVVTREQMAAFIIRALGMPNPPPPAFQRFADVPPSSPFYAFIDQMAVRGITAGCGGGNYCPGAVVTREQMAAFIIKAAGIPNPPTPATQRFTDVPPSSPFYAFIEQMALRGVTAGCGADTYCPTNSVTRSAMAAFLVRGFGLPDPGTPGASLANTARFLEQATFGPTPAEVTRVQNIGIRAFLDEQFALPISGYPAMALQPTTIPPACDSDPICRRDNYSHYLLQRRFFERAMYEPDQLRQRVAWTLHKMIVVSGNGLMQPSWMVPYLKILDDNAFGNYRDLLGQITLNPAMGLYLDMMTSTRTNPNENYAREILQLFSVGTDKLNLDGTPVLDINGLPIPTYDQAVVEGFTKALTGWRLAPQPLPGVAAYDVSMVLDTNGTLPLSPNNHDFTAKTLLDGGSIPARTSSLENANQDLTDALNNIFNHPNVGPFVAKHFIQNLVTSNPTPAYVARVATKFNDNGAGVRGDLKAVVEAVLLDPEARGDVKGGPTAGHLREPALFICNMMRLFDAKSADRLTNSDGYLNPNSISMDQDVLRPTTVFSYFPADFGLPGASGLIGPEFGILSTSTTLRRANFINTMVFSRINVSTNAPQGTSLSFDALQALAGTPSALVDEVNRLMLYNTMSPEMRNSIITAVTAVSASNPLKRARTAVYLVATSSQYQVQR
jgi:uncharacterized protein (DUF1800 family)